MCVLRDREPEKLASLKSELLSLGADVVVTDTLATSREFSDVLKYDVDRQTERRDDDE